MMGNYEQLKSAIAAVIKTNGNNEITGALLQQVLIGMTSQIGANMTFKGIATPATQPATPDQNCFYMATERGTYSNFDGQELDGTKLAIFFNSSGAWRSWLMPIVDFTFDNTPTEDSTNPVTSDGIFKALMQHDDIIFFADVNGTKYEVEYVWNPRVQDWDELMSDTPLEINAGKIYIDHISFDMFTSPYVGAWIQLNALQASTYSGTVMTEQTAIAPTGTISKTASGVTKTFNLPAESGTLARKEETLPNKTYAPAEFSGLGRKYLQKNIVSNKNVLTQAMVNDANTVYVVQYDYDLNDPDGESPITLPANCALKFEGGSINNGKIVFQDTSLESCKECFGDDLVIEGKVLQEASPEWFTGSDADKIEKAINTFGVVQLAARDYLIDRTINVQHSFRLNGIGIPSNFGNYATPSKSDDYSSSRLIPIADIGSILACVNPSGKYVSVVLSGVSFARPANEAWFNGYETATANVHGFAFSTPGGPSRPIVIENCNFSRLNYGIYMYDHNPSLDKSTNVGHLHITGCNISKNKQGIHAEGKKTLGGVMILNSVIEQNRQYGIYAYNPTGSVQENQAVITDFCEIVGCLMEGQTNPIYCSVERGTIILRGNYLENPNGSTVTIRGKNLTWGYQTLILDSNTASTNIGSGVVYDLQVLKLIDRDNGNAAGSLLLSNAKIDGQTNKLIRTTSFSGYTPRIGVNSIQPLLKGLITPNYIYDDKVQLRYITSSDTQSIITLTEVLPAGNYTLVTFGRDLNLALRKNVSGTTTKIFDYSNASPINDNEYTVNERAFTLDEAIPAGAQLRIGVQGGSGAFSGFAIYADNGSPHTRYSINPLDYVYSTKGDVVNPQIGVEWYDKALSKTLRIADIVNGAAVWKDLYGFTPALSRGATAQRPTLTLGIDDIGFEYFDTDIVKEIAFTLATGAVAIDQTRDGNTTVYVANPFASGNFAKVSVTSSYSIQNRIEIAFVKADDDETDAIYIQDGLVYTNPNPNSYYADGYIVAPDPSVYTKIKIANNASGYRLFRFFEASPSWFEADGATAGVKRSGTTANRPVSTDIYTGFQYWDTTLGKMIAWNGTAWVNLDGTALS